MNFCCSGPTGLNYVGSTILKSDHVSKCIRLILHWVLLNPLPTSNSMAEPMSKGQLWLAVKVVFGSRVLFSFNIISCTETETFDGLLSRLEREHFTERCIEKVVIVVQYCCAHSSFKILMNSQRKTLLPKKINFHRADQRMYMMIDLLASWSVGWSPRQLVSTV